LPVHTEMSEETLNLITGTVKQFFEKSVSTVSSS
jgi:hypothetical protein